jgi:hypothetical protein
MANQNFCETSRVEQPNRLQVSEKRKRSYWLRSIVAGAGMLAGNLLAFDWYFFSVVYGLFSRRRPVAAVFSQASGDRQSRRLPSSSVQQRSSDRSTSLIVPVRSAANLQNSSKLMRIETFLSRTRQIGTEQSGVASMSSRDNGKRPVGGLKKKDGTVNEQISAWPISANAPSNIEQFSYVAKLVALTHLYVELSLPLPAALRAAEADLR